MSNQFPQGQPFGQNQPGQVPHCQVLGLSVEWEDHFFVESGAFDQVGFAQMVGLVGIDYSFD
jgi:hypothetical protein